MTQCTLTIKTDVQIDNCPGALNLSRNIKVDDAHQFTVTVPKDAPGCRKCFLVGVGPRDLLKFLLLRPVPVTVTVPVPEPVPVKVVDPAPAKTGGQPAVVGAHATATVVPTPATEAPKPVPENPDDPDGILKKGFSFWTVGDSGKSDTFELTEPQIYIDDQLDSLFGAGQRNIEKIVFENHTGHCVDVTIVYGKDLTCDVDDTSCGTPHYGKK